MSFSVGLHKRFVEQAAWTRQAQVLFAEAAGVQPDSRILEVGCGTGALISSMNALRPASYFGIDIQPDLLDFARENNLYFPLASSDGCHLPFASGQFDAVICHYFLLWIKDVGQVLAEMCRVTRNGGIVAALAEPDYGNRIDYPEEFALLGKKQREALIRQGADADMGRKLAWALSEAGCERIATGILGSFQPEPHTASQIASEQKILESDLGNAMDPQHFQTLMKKDATMQSKNSRVQFIPTFFGWGYKP
jgi:SAM-dependent methyltransferase